MLKLKENRKKSDDYLQLFDSGVDAAGADSGRVERLSQMNDSTASLDHRIFLVVLDELGEAGEFLPTSDIVLVILE